MIVQKKQSTEYIGSRILNLLLSTCKFSPHWHRHWFALCILSTILVLLFYELLTVAVPVEQEGILQLELQVFVDRLYQVLCAKSVHDGEAMVRGGRPQMKKRLQTL